MNLPASSRTLIVGCVVLVLAAATLGAIVPAYVDTMGESGAKLLVLPAALLLAFLTAYSRTVLLLLIIGLRASGDVILEASKFSVGGAQIGIGGLINAFVILIALLLVLENPKRLPPLVFRVWGGFLSVALVGVVLSPDRGTAIRLYLQIISTFSIFVGAFFVVSTQQDFRRCVRIVVAASVIPVVFGLYQFLTGQGTQSPDAGIRIQSTFSHPNILGCFLSLAIPMLLYLLKTAPAGKKPLIDLGLTLYLFAMLAVLALTKTRSAWVACAIMFAAYGMLFERRYLVYLAVGGVALLFIPGIGDRIIEIADKRPAISSLTPLDSFQWRVSIWESGLGWMTPLHYPIGYGLDSFPFYSTTFFRESNNIQWGAHNVFVEVFFELGAAGVLAFVWMYLSPLKYLRPLWSTDRLAAFFLTITLIEYLVAAASDNLLQYLSFNWYVWFMCGAGIALAQAGRDPNARSPFDPEPAA